MVKAPPKGKQTGKPSKTEQRGQLDAMLNKLARRGTVFLQDLKGELETFKSLFNPDRIEYFVKHHKIQFCPDCKELFRRLGWDCPPNHIFRGVRA